MSIQVTILGSGGVYSTQTRNPPAYYLKTNKESFLIDVGEGAQKEILKNDLPFFVDFVILSHFHVDHYAGLVPYLLTMSIIARKVPLKIYAPSKEFLINLLLAHKKNFFETLNYPLEIVEIIENITYIEDSVSIKFFKSTHSILAYGAKIISLNNISYNKKALTDWGSQEEISELIKRGQYKKNSKEFYAKDFISSTEPTYAVYYSGDTAINSRLWGLIDTPGIVLHDCTYYYKSDQTVKNTKGHTHYLDLVSKINQKEKTLVGLYWFLIHLGPKLNVKSFKNKIEGRKKNIYFTHDSFFIEYNYKNKVLKIGKDDRS